MVQESVTSPAHRPEETLGVRRRRSPAWFMLLVAFTVGATAWACAGPGNPIGDFDITMYTGASRVGGEQINTSDLRGQPVVLNFWAGLCPPCRAEMPHFQVFYDEYGDRVTLIGVDVGQFTGLGDRDDAAALLDSLKISYPTGYTTDRNIMREYSVLTMPTTVFINSRGEVFRKYDSFLPLEQLVSITNDMLSQEPG